MPFTYKPLFKLLIDRDMKKTDLREAIGIGPSTLAKFEKGENVSLDVIDRLCSYFGVQPSDIIEHTQNEKESTEE
ncbi:XRE family transcriptional regulator [Paenibacillus larvae subsp. pulvifaciens]|uniref:XRE family transcriptional regulator n=2 Tax=Paenibacillus larvae TaxID=1464 RepID=A0A1V0UP05_9BACL|nr:helix-turn-helix transcriptional regulator [Paenibacillus larvae]ARF67005.1 XRE family transcriptional regulator [Paenibacillus larvae subsp. pulvifaciens]QHZ52135.1 putative transcriptional regulator [Paenibacillus larvae subsp. larvae]